MHYGHCSKCGYLIPFINERKTNIVCPECATNHSMAHTPDRSYALFPIKPHTGDWLLGGT